MDFLSILISAWKEQGIFQYSHASILIHPQPFSFTQTQVICKQVKFWSPSKVRQCFGLLRLRIPSPVRKKERFPFIFENGTVLQERVVGTQASPYLWNYFTPYALLWPQQMTVSLHMHPQHTHTQTHPLPFSCPCTECNCALCIAKSCIPVHF